MDRLKRFSRKKRFEKWLWLMKVGDVRTVDGTKLAIFRFTIKFLVWDLALVEVEVLV